MNQNKETSISKFLSLVLRHAPEKINIHPDSQGWVLVDELIHKSEGKFNLDELKRVVHNNDKQRFSFNEDQSKIRANQGHSIPIDLDLQAEIPPPFLYHGTATRNLDSIRKIGLLKQNRHHVHLSENRDTAQKVGQRYGDPYVLSIRSSDMFKSGFRFFKTENDVWLTEHVPPQFIDNQFEDKD